jgi:peptidoglycan/LPS O-acetylase OafA/YrhL
MLANISKQSITTRAADGHALPGLDGLRGIAILLVMFFHLAQMKPASSVDSIFYKLTAYGWSGVDLFFVLSGFLITGILVDAKGTENYFRNFYARRALRILPLYYGFFAALLLLSPLVGGQKAAEGVRVLYENQWWIWTHTVNWLTALTGEFQPLSVGGWWSLSIEEQFYLLWAVVIMLTPQRKLLRLCLALIVASILIRFAMVAFGASWAAIYTVTFARMDGIALGAAIAVTARTEVGLGNVKRWSLIAAALALAGFVIMETLSGTAYEPGSTFSIAIQITLFVWLWGALLVGTLVALPGSFLQRLTHLKILRIFGKFSFALYLFHMLMNDVFLKIGFNPDSGVVIGGSILPWQMLYLGAAISLSLICAYLSWHLYEKHFLKLKSFFPMPKRPLVEPLQSSANSFRGALDASAISEKLLPSSGKDK